jgi:hypothetical protein
MSIPEQTINEIHNFILYLIQFLLSPWPPFDQWIAIIKIIFIILSLFFLFSIIYFLFRTSWLNFRYINNIIEFLIYKPLGIGKTAKQWEKMKRRLETGLESEYKLIIIEADSIFSSTLEKMGYTDENFEERIKHLTLDILPNMEEVLEAHKIRNSVVHDPDYRLDLDETKRIILIYEKALINLQAL